jgi:hypothetical protein
MGTPPITRGSAYRKAAKNYATAITDINSTLQKGKHSEEGLTVAIVEHLLMAVQALLLFLLDA